MAENVLELTDADFDDVVNGSQVPVLVDFWAPWCGPCKMMGPVLEELASEVGEKAKIYKVNTDESRDSAIEFGITSIPTLILFNQGQIAKKWSGLTNKEDILEEINELL